MAIFNNSNPYNQPQQSKIAASSSVGQQSNQPPANAFMQGLNGAWNGIANSIGGAWNKFVNTPTGGIGTNSIAQNTQQIGSFLNNAKKSLDVASNNPYGASQLQIPKPPLQGNPSIDVAAPANAKTLSSPSNQTQYANGLPPDDPSNKYNTATGQLNTNYSSYVAPQNGKPTTDAQSNYIQQQATTQNPTVRQQVINSQANIAPQAQQNLQKAQQNLQDFQTGYANSVGKISGEPIGLDFQQGQKQVIANQYAQELPAYQTAVNTAQQALGQGVTANQNVISATQPVLGGIGSQQFYYPDSAMGGGTQGGQSGGTLNPMNNISSIAAQVINNQLTPSQAESMGGSISNWSGALNAEIQKQSPGFNFNQANVNSQTAGALAPQSSLATQELQNLQTTLENVPAWQKTSIPAINALGSLVDNALGMGSAQGLTSAVSAARSSITTALGTAYNTTPTAFTGMVNSWIPDNPTPEQVKAAIGQFDTLMKARASSFTSPGTTQNPLGGNQSSSPRIYNY